MLDSKWRVHEYTRLWTNNNEEPSVLSQNEPGNYILTLNLPLKIIIAVLNWDW